ncbi:NAD(P)H-dependent amine dehydrogenase family protein [Nocardia bovistercoris]|uniref:Dihydrodipicolinate reductase n=1 Tax=Nocardia bovistercoris TaxID=2785916 RepID=A0A931N5A6_9NOCA|nr:dihydrodipicolinate reductase [Nocardia bovistercoris]MBH0778463.1 dihydrodipicolinate reductase [Nocardia bovistercoris]
MTATARIPVAVWATGVVGRIAIRQILTRADLELVAVHVHDPAKAGRDVGELVGVAPVGVVATAAPEEVIAAGPQCVVYAAASPELDATYVPDYLRLLAAGIDVLTVSTPGLVYPPAWDPNHVDALTEAARGGGATLYATGIEPGFAADQLVVLLTTMSASIESIRTQEIFRYDSYENDFLMREVFGFGKPLDHTPLMLFEGAQQLAWGPPVRYVAAALGVELDSIRETYERAPTPRDLDVAVGRIDAGTCGAVRMETIGVVDGRDFLVIEHVNRMAPDLAPAWPDADRDGTYRVIIDGKPSTTCELTFGSTEQESSEHGLIATAMRLVNAIPYVAASAPGLTTSLDLPLTAPRL